MVVKIHNNNNFLAFNNKTFSRLKHFKFLCNKKIKLTKRILEILKHNYPQANVQTLVRNIRSFNEDKKSIGKELNDLAVQDR